MIQQILCEDNKPHHWEVVHFGRVNPNPFEEDIFWCIRCGCLGMFPHRDYDDVWTPREVLNLSHLRKAIYVHRKPHRIPLIYDFPPQPPTIRRKLKI